MFAERRILLLALFLWLPLSAAEATPAIETWNTPNGARVLFVAAPALPMVDVQVVFDAGSARDGAQSGLASLTAAMLTQGAGDWDADAIAERLDDVGASLSTGVDRDMASVAGRSLTSEPAYGRLVETMAAVLAAPTFATKDLARLRENRLIGLRRDDQDPGTVGSKAIYRLIFGDHPYAADPSGTPAAVAALTREDLVAFHHRWYTARNAVVAIVGALERDQAEALASRLTAGLPGGEAAPALPPIADPSRPAVQAIPFPSSQAHVYVGQPGMRRGDPDYFPLYVGNHILGGSGLVSLLVDEVREKRGLSYSVYSYFLPLAERGPFLMGLQTKTEQAAQAEDVLRATLERFIAEGPSDKELTAAVRNITGGFPLRIASNGSIVQYLAVIGFYRLPLDHLERFNERVSAVSASQIRDAFARRIAPDRLAVVTVGPAGAPTADRDLGAVSTAAPPAQPGLRPTPDRVRETLFNWLQPFVAGSRCLDLFAGSGALGLEARSRGAAEVILIERAESVVRALRTLVRDWRLTGVEVRHAEAMRWLEGTPHAFDIVFLDPPFAADLLGPACARLARGGWLAAGAHVYLEAAAKDGLPPLPADWTLVRQGQAGDVAFALAVPEGPPTD